MNYDFENVNYNFDNPKLQFQKRQVCFGVKQTMRFENRLIYSYISRILPIISIHRNAINQSVIIEPPIGFSLSITWLFPKPV